MGRSLSILLCLTALATAQGTWPVAMLEDADLHDVQFVDAQTGWTVGDRGVIWHTHNGGRHWDLQQTPVGCSLRGVFFLDAKRGWAVGGETVPYLQRGRGVVLRTDNGGQTWIKEQVASLPALRGVWFQSKKQGYAIGDGSPLFPAGVFVTTDAGRSWNPIAVRGLAGWQAASFRDDGSGLLLSPQGQILRCRDGHCLPAKTPLPKHRMHDICWLDDVRAFAVGNARTLWKTVDTGAHWSQLTMPAAPGEIQDFRSVVCSENSIWIGGSPGFVVLHSSDGGQTWRSQTSGQSTPIHGLAFHGTSNGLAVGALGKILSTADGGVTWTPQRGQGRRLFALGIFTAAQQVPWNLWAKLAGDRGGRVRTVVINSAADQPLTHPLEERLQGATVQVGGQGGGVWHTLDPSSIDLAMATWQPDCIFTDPADSGDPTSTALQAAVMAAVQQAPRPIRVWTKATPGGQIHERVSNNGLAMPLGQSIGSLAAQASAHLTDRYLPSEPSSAFTSVIGSSNLNAGLIPAGANCRQYGLLDQSAGQQIQRLAQKQTVLRTLLSRAAKGSTESAAWLSQIENMTAEMSQARAATTLYELALLHFQNGDAEPALRSLESLTRKYPRQPIAAAATRDAVLWVCSAELSHHVAQRKAAVATTPDVPQPKSADGPLRLSRHRPAPNSLPQREAR